MKHTHLDPRAQAEGSMLDPNPGRVGAAVFRPPGEALPLPNRGRHGRSQKSDK